ncbi:hypothetical protein CLF_112655 [Clonorchis sinensis]|uniref:Uncharacterized protein n=1 Tax=Clonorchis sinensis TaxID=79923 RepID=G7YWR2_CLOSI|nr:hypothetical protein CLF_112655 [Clonorchis sinensis]
MTELSEQNTNQCGNSNEIKSAASESLLSSTRLHVSKDTWSNDIGLVELATPLASPDGTFRFVRLPKSKKAGSKLKSGLFKGFKNSYLFEKSAKEERNFKMTVFAPIICPAFYWPERQKRGFCAGAPIEAQFTPAGTQKIASERTDLVFCYRLRFHIRSPFWLICRRLLVNKTGTEIPARTDGKQEACYRQLEEHSLKGTMQRELAQLLVISKLRNVDMFLNTSMYIHKISYPHAKDSPVVVIEDGCVCNNSNTLVYVGNLHSAGILNVGAENSRGESRPSYRCAVVPTANKDGTNSLIEVFGAHRWEPNYSRSPRNQRIDLNMNGILTHTAITPDAFVICAFRLFYGSVGYQIPVLPIRSPSSELSRLLRCNSGQAHVALW